MGAPLTEKFKYKDQPKNHVTCRLDRPKMRPDGHPGNDGIRLAGRIPERPGGPKVYATNHFPNPNNAKLCK